MLEQRRSTVPQFQASAIGESGLPMLWDKVFAELFDMRQDLDRIAQIAVDSGLTSSDFYAAMIRTDREMDGDALTLVYEMRDIENDANKYAFRL